MGEFQLKQPLVSVIIPFYSNSNWLCEAIDSVLNQTYKNIEILVINDGSPEDLSHIIEKYGFRITLINKKNGGPSSARNLGIKKSKGKYVAFLDSDDVWLPEKLSKQIHQMEKNGYVWSQHSYEMFWEDSKRTKIINTEIYRGNVYKDCFISFKVQTSCVVILRSILIENKIYFPLNRRFGQDIAFFKQIAKQYSLGYIDGVYSRFRIRGSNAGFRAKVQLLDKSTVWNELKGDKQLKYLLPIPIIIAYKTSSGFAKVLRFINQNLIKNQKKVEYLAKVLYLLPYFLFKLYARKK